MSGIGKQLALLDQRRGVKNLRSFPGFDNTGATDATANWEAAMAGGGVTEIPAGTYLLEDCYIPAAADITLRPLGPVIIKQPASGAAALFYDGTGNVSATTSVTAVGTINTWPVSNLQVLSKIDGSFAGYAVGDVVHIMSNDATTDTFIKGEFFKVLYVHGDNSYIIADRVLFYSYDAATYTTVCRRFTATPKLTILPGIVLDTSVSPIGTLASRPFGLIVRAAVEPEIDIEVRNTYSTGVRLQGVYGGRADAKTIGVDVDYDDSAFGYGLELKGPVHSTVCSVYADGGGHSFVTNGDLTTWDTAAWYRSGTPQAFTVKEFRSRNCAAAPFDMHWAIRPRVVSVIIEDAHRDSNVARSAQHGIYIGAVDPWIGVASVKNARAALTIRDTRGLPTTYRIGELHYESTAQSPTTPALVLNDAYSQVGGSRPVVEIGGGTCKVAGRFPILASGSHDAGYTLKLWGMSFYGSPGLVWYNSATYPAFVEFHKGCVWHPDAGSTDGVLRADAACTDRVKVYDLTIIRDGGSTPNGLVRASGTVTCTLMVGEITLDGGTLPATTSGSSGTAVVTIKKPDVWGELIASPTGSATIDPSTGLVLCSHTSGTPTITLKDPALFPGRKVTIKNLALSSGGNVTVAAAAGTISGATTLAAATKDRATYIANGSVWEQVA